MSRQFRYRVTTIVLGGFFLGVPLLTNAAASARLGDRQVTFEGGGRVTMSNPLVVPVALPSLPVPPTGQSRLGVSKMPVTSAAGSARPGAVLPVRPHRTEPAVQPPPSGHPDVDRPRAVHPSVDRPRSHRRTADRSGAGRPSLRHTAPHATATSGWMRRHHATRSRTPSKTKVKTSTGTAGGVAGNGVPVPGGVPRFDVTPMATSAEPRAGAEPSSRVASSPSAAAEPVAAMRSAPPGNRIGLLGMVASVCAAGVTIATIRAIVFKRANRRIMA